MGRTRNSSRNIYSGIANRVVQLLLSFISRRIFINVLGIGYLGINGLFSDILGMLSMADLGFGTAMAYSFYKPIATDDKAMIAALVNFYKKVYTVIALVVGILGISILPFLRFIVNLDNPIKNLEMYYLAFLVNTIFSYLYIYKSSILAADQKGYEINRISLLINSAKSITQIFILVIFKNYLLLILTTIVYTITNNILISNKADRLYPFIKSKLFLLSEQRNRIYKNLLSVFIVKISSALINSTDNIIISYYIGTTFVGLYSNYYIVTSQIFGFVTIFYSSLTASIGNLIETESADERYNIFKITQMTSYIVSGVVVVCSYFLLEDLIVVWLGKSYILDSLTLTAILLNIYMQVILQPIWTFREATALYLKTKYVMLMTALINIALSILFAKFLGVGGVLLATFISRLLTYFWYEPILLFRKYFCRGSISYFRDVLINSILVLIIILIVIPLNNMLGTYSWTSILVRGILFSSFTILVYVIRFWKSYELENLVGRLKLHFWKRL